MKLTSYVYQITHLTKLFCEFTQHKFRNKEIKVFHPLLLEALSNSHLIILLKITWSIRGQSLPMKMSGIPIP